MWRALAAIFANDDRLRDSDFDSLAARAEFQEAQVEQRRLEAAQSVFRADRRRKPEPMLSLQKISYDGVEERKWSPPNRNPETDG